MAITSPQLDIWQGASGNWYVGYTKSFSKNRDNWLIDARALGMEPAEWLQWLIDNYQPDYIRIRPDGRYLTVSWTKQAKANAYKLYINKIIRNKKFAI